MAGLFTGLETGKRALETHQLWLNTIGHNISNVNTPGYTRQRVRITRTLPFDHKNGLVGTGITATDIHHIRDLFLNQQFRSESQAVGKWTTAEKTLTQIEGIFAEPNEGSINDLLNKFWNSWSELATADGPSTTARELLVNDTRQLVSAMHRIYRQLRELQQSVDDDIVLAVEKVNIITDEIAALNKQIARTEVGGDNANDLRDKRDLLIDELSQYVNVNTREQANGTTTVYLGSLAIVDADSFYKLDTAKEYADAAALSRISWDNTDDNVKILDGQIKGLLETRDEIIPKYIEALDELAAALVSNINSLHRTGYDLQGNTGIDFFDPYSTSAQNIRLSDDIEINPGHIAATSNGDPDNEGNREIALAIADLSKAKLMLDNTVTISEYYHNFVDMVGVESGRAIHMKSNAELLVARLENSRQSVQGISLDEEMANMIKFQHAYDAAARIITTMDEALEVVIMRMGITGKL